MTFDSIRVRFLLGGRHGDFKFLPPSGYAPCYEALLPKEKMKVEPVKEYKRDVAGVRDLLGTAQLLSQASFIPTPVETSQVKGDSSTWILPKRTSSVPSSAPPLQIIMPPHLEKVRDKLAENIHELWGMNKIELGWTYGKVRSTAARTITESLSHTFDHVGIRNKHHRGSLFLKNFFFLIYRTFSQAAAANALVVSTY